MIPGNFLLPCEVSLNAPGQRLTNLFNDTSPSLKKSGWWCQTRLRHSGSGRIPLTGETEFVDGRLREFDVRGCPPAPEARTIFTACDFLIMVPNISAMSPFTVDSLIATKLHVSSSAFVCQ